MAIYYQGNPLQDKDKLNAKGIGEGDLLYMTLVPLAYQQQQQQPKPQVNIADMIKNFDKNRKQSGDQYMFKEKGIEEFMPSAEQAYAELKDDQYRLS